MKLPDQLTSERLLLRPYVSDDFTPFFDFLSLPEATRFLRFTPQQKTLDGASAFFDDVIASYSSYRPIFALAIILKDNKKYIGSCGLTPLEDGISVACYYVLLPEYWGRGFAVEAVQLLFGYAFSQLRIERIIAMIHPENQASHQVAEKLGMMYEGAVFDRETAQNVDCFSLLKKDYERAITSFST